MFQCAGQSLVLTAWIKTDKKAIPRPYHTIKPHVSKPWKWSKTCTNVFIHAVARFKCLNFPYWGSIKIKVHYLILNIRATHSITQYRLDYLKRLVAIEIITWKKVILSHSEASPFFFFFLKHECTNECNCYDPSSKLAKQDKLVYSLIAL